MPEQPLMFQGKVRTFKYWLAAMPVHYDTSQTLIEWWAAYKEAQRA